MQHFKERKEMEKIRFRIKIEYHHLASKIIDLCCKNEKVAKLIMESKIDMFLFLKTCKPFEFYKEGEIYVVIGTLINNESAVNFVTDFDFSEITCEVSNEPN